jgi:hypothetical protein
MTAFGARRNIGELPLGLDADVEPARPDPHGGQYRPGQSAVEIANKGPGPQRASAAAVAAPGYARNEGLHGGRSLCS